MEPPPPPPKPPTPYQLAVAQIDLGRVPESEGRTILERLLSLDPMPRSFTEAARTIGVFYGRLYPLIQTAIKEPGKLADPEPPRVPYTPVALKPSVVAALRAIDITRIPYGPHRILVGLLRGDDRGGEPRSYLEVGTLMALHHATVRAIVERLRITPDTRPRWPMPAFETDLDRAYLAAEAERAHAAKAAPPQYTAEPDLAELLSGVTPLEWTITYSRPYVQRRQYLMAILNGNQKRAFSLVEQGYALFDVGHLHMGYAAKWSALHDRIPVRLHVIQALEKRQLVVEAPPPYRSEAVGVWVHPMALGGTLPGLTPTVREEGICQSCHGTVYADLLTNGRCRICTSSRHEARITGLVAELQLEPWAEGMDAETLRGMAESMLRIGGVAPAKLRSLDGGA
jgi:hypothetical protein